MEHRKSSPNHLLGPEALVLRMMGIWRPERGGGSWPGVLLATVSLAAVASVPAGAALRLCADFPEELEELALCSYMLIMCSGSVIKVALFLREGRTLRELMWLLNSTRSQYGSGEKSESIRNCYKKMVDRLYRYFQVMIVPSLLCWVASPLLMNGALDGGQESQRQLPIPLWLPTDIHSSPLYELVYVTQTICLTITAEATMCLDVFFVRLMTLVAAEIEVLSQNVSTMHSFHSKGTPSGDHLDVVRGREEQLLVPGSVLPSPAANKCSENVPDEEMFSRLVKNVHHHQTILRSVSLLQMAMNVSTFILLFINMANLCSNTFVTAGLLQRDDNLTKAMKALLTIPPVMFQTGMYCIFGQITTDQSEKLSYSAFSCGWINCDCHFKRCLLIFMMMVGKPIEITVGKTCPLSKQMLLQVLNGTYVLLNMVFQVSQR